MIRVKVIDKKHKGPHSSEYKNTIDLNDYKAIAVFLEDLKVLFESPVEKAFREMQKHKSPFY